MIKHDPELFIIVFGLFGFDVTYVYSHVVHEIDYRVSEIRVVREYDVVLISGNAVIYIDTLPEEVHRGVYGFEIVSQRKNGEVWHIILDVGGLDLAFVTSPYARTDADFLSVMITFKNQCQTAFLSDFLALKRLVLYDIVEY